MTAKALILPALGLLLALLPGFAVTLDLVLLSTEIVVDAANRMILGVVALLWAAAAFRQAADGWRELRYRLCFVLTQAGSLIALLAADPVGYYAGFSLMTVASYGIVDVRAKARRAATLYLAAALIGEMILLAGLMMIGAGTPLAPWLILVGLGAKLGMLPFHVALPPAYAVAPPAAAAMLGGVLTTVAAVGWLRFLPAAGGIEATGVVVGLGLAAAFVGAGLGLFQRDAKALLGYSTVSQMGILTAGVGLASAGTWQVATPLLTLFVLHHALAKAALLFGVDRSGRALGRAGWVALLLLALSLAGFPATGGTVAKGGIEGMAGDLALLVLLLPITSLATAALMTRFLLLARPRTASVPLSLAWPGLACAAAALLLPWLLADAALAALAWTPAKMAAHVWPAVAGAVLALVKWRLLHRWSVPAGDVATWIGRRARAAGLTGLRRPARETGKLRWAVSLPDLERPDRLLRSMSAVGLLFAVTIGALLLLVAVG